MALPTGCVMLQKNCYEKIIKAPTEEEIDMFLKSLNLKKNDLCDKVINPENFIQNICDYCSKPCHGITYRYKIKVFYKSKAKRDKYYYAINNMCKKCNNKNNEFSEFIGHVNHYNNLYYNYDIIAINKISTNEYIYVVKEYTTGNDGDVDIHYYLKYYKDGKIFLDHELQTYNPYFGCDIIDIQFKKDENIIKVIYSEKHQICEVDLELQYDISHNILLKSKPQSFSRSQNNNTSNHEIGKIIKFIKNGVISENNKYF